jgi:programmed cell death protein 5
MPTFKPYTAELSMAEYYDDEEVEEIKRRKLLEYQRQLEAAQAEEEKLEEIRRQKQEILRKILTPEARARLANLRMVRPELVEYLENQLIQLVYSGRLQAPITDEVLKEILMQLLDRQREIKLRFTKVR